MRFRCGQRSLLSRMENSDSKDWRFFASLCPVAVILSPASSFPRVGSTDMALMSWKVDPMLTSSLVGWGLAVASSLAVQFDVPPLVPAVEVTQSALVPQIPNSRFVQVRLEVSTIVSPEFRGALDETLIKIITRKPLSRSLISLRGPKWYRRSQPPCWSPKTMIGSARRPFRVSVAIPALDRRVGTLIFTTTCVAMSSTSSDRPCSCSRPPGRSIVAPESTSSCDRPLNLFWRELVPIGLPWKCQPIGARRHARVSSRRIWPKEGRSGRGPQADR